MIHVQTDNGRASPRPMGLEHDGRFLLGILMRDIPEAAYQRSSKKMIFMQLYIA